MTDLVVRAGPAALEQLRSRGWRWEDFEVVLGASGGPKWLVLSALDRGLMEVLAGNPRPVHLLGSSSGAYRFLAYVQEQPQAALAALEQAYVDADWTLLRPLPLRRQTALGILRAFARPGPLTHPVFRLHVSTALCRGWLAREERLLQLLGVVGVSLLALFGRRHMRRWVERVLFSDPRTPLPSRLDDLSSTRVDLDEHNVLDAVLASGAIPLVLPAERDVLGAPRGALRDGGLVDYHFDQLRLQPQGLILFPHFVSDLQPGWLERYGRRRRLAPEILERLVLIAPAPEWSRRLPGGKIPDRQDAARMGKQERRRNWRETIQRSEELAAGLVPERLLERARPF